MSLGRRSMDCEKLRIIARMEGGQKVLKHACRSEGVHASYKMYLYVSLKSFKRSHNTSLPPL